MTTATFILRLLTATFAGMIIGFEIQWHQKSAGIRTNALAAIGSARYGAPGYLAAGYYIQTLIGTVVVIKVNTLLLPLDEWLLNRIQ